jgi:hypothetical protein
MNAKVALEYQWPYLLSFFPPEHELDASALRTGALKRRRVVNSASTLLRLALAYGFCGLSLRDTTAWAEASGFASLSDVALLKRLRHAGPWIGHLLAVKLAERAKTPRPRDTSLRLRLVDATTISRPGSSGTDWRVHLGFNLRSLAIDHVELTDQSGGETLTRFQFAPGDVVLGDRGYAHRRGLHSVQQQEGHFIVRLNWQNIPLQDRQNGQVDLLGLLRGLPEARAAGFDLQIAPDRRHSLPALPVRLAAIRKTETAAEQSRQKILQQTSKKGKTPDPRTLEAAAYIFVVTSLAEEQASAEQLLDLYRFRWQIELAFKRMKGLLELGVLPAKDRRLAHTIIYSKLLAALLLDDFTERFLAISPWGYRIA